MSEEKWKKNLIEVLRRALHYVDSFAYPEKITKESENVLKVKPLGTTLAGDVYLYVVVDGESVQVYTDPIYKGVRVNHPFFSAMKKLCMDKKVGFRPDTDKGVLLSVKHKIRRVEDIHGFIMKVYELGAVLKQSNDIFKKYADLVEDKFAQKFVKIGPYEKGVVLRKDANTFIRNEPFRDEVATIPDQNGFFWIRQGDVLIGSDVEEANENIPPYVIFFKFKDKEGSRYRIFLPTVIIDWEQIESPAGYMEWDGSYHEDSLCRGIVWKDLNVIAKNAGQMRDIFEKAVKGSKKSNGQNLAILTVQSIIKRLDKLSNSDNLFSRLRDGTFTSLPIEIMDLIEDMELYWNKKRHCLCWINDSLFRIVIEVEKCLTNIQKKNIVELAMGMWKFAYELDWGLTWAMRFKNKVVLWLSAIQAKEEKDEYDIFGNKILGAAKGIVTEFERKAVTTKDVLEAGSIELKKFMAKTFEKARFVCPECGNNKILKLHLYKTNQGIVISCPKCGSKFASQQLSLEARIAQNLFIVDTSALIAGITSEMVTQGIVEEPFIIVPKAVEFELQRLLKGNKKAEGKKGLAELKKLRELTDKKKISFIVEGDAPTEEMTLLSKEWKIGLDMMIIEKAKEYSGTILTCDDQDMSGFAETEGLRTLVYKR